MIFKRKLNIPFNLNAFFQTMFFLKLYVKYIAINCDVLCFFAEEF